MEFLTLGNELEIKIQRECFLCGGNLWRNGYSHRIVLSLNVCVRLVVPRVVCSGCRKTGTCLYDFLVPYKRYEAAVHAEYVKAYLTTEASYRDVAWSDLDGDNLDAEASLSRAFRAVGEACDSGEVFLQQVQQGLVEQQIEVPELDAEWVKPVQSGSKLQRLFFLFIAMLLAARFCSECRDSWLFVRRYISLGYSLKQLGFRLSAPQTLQQTLF